MHKKVIVALIGAVMLGYTYAVEPPEDYFPGMILVNFPGMYSHLRTLRLSLPIT